MRYLAGKRRLRVRIRLIQVIRLTACGLVALLLNTSAWAGPPFATDDPGVLPVHTGELYLFATGTHAIDGTALDASPGIEANYSLSSNTFFHLVAPLVLVKPSGYPSQFGPGDLEFGFKWRFLAQTDARPDFGFFPLVELPTGSEGRGLGAGKVQAFLPIWIQKDVGKWTSYGGGGYWINPGDGNNELLVHRDAPSTSIQRSAIPWRRNLSPDGRCHRRHCQHRLQSGRGCYHF